MRDRVNTMKTLKSTYKSISCISQEINTEDTQMRDDKGS